MFGRVAAGLVHDLSHPIQNIGNSTRLLLRDDVDLESKEMFRRTIERELAALKRFMEDLRHVVKPKPIERFAMDVNASVAEIVETMRAEGEQFTIDKMRKVRSTGYDMTVLALDPLRTDRPEGVAEGRPLRHSSHLHHAKRDAHSGADNK